MEFKLPLTVDNGHGETATFTKIVKEAKGDKLFFEARTQPGSGPMEHIHLKQEEYFEIIQGQMSYQVGDQAPAILTAGQGIQLPEGIPHKFWNSGSEELVFKGWVQPANNFIFFITTLFESMKTQKKPAPAPLDGAFLLTRYASEYSMIEIPLFARKVVIPITYLVGKLSGQYKKYENAPEPV